MNYRQVQVRGLRGLRGLAKGDWDSSTKDFYVPANVSPALAPADPATQAGSTPFYNFVEDPYGVAAGVPEVPKAPGMSTATKIGIGVAVLGLGFLLLSGSSSRGQTSVGALWRSGNKRHDLPWYMVVPMDSAGRLREKKVQVGTLQDTMKAAKAEARRSGHDIEVRCRTSKERFVVGPE